MSTTDQPGQLSEPTRTVHEKWRLAAAILGALTLGLSIYLIAAQVHSNKLAIEKSCVLLNNAILRSQAQATKQGSSTAILVGIILRKGTEQEVADFFAATEREKTVANPILVKCKKVADDPDQIKADPIRTITAPPPT